MFGTEGSNPDVYEYVGRASTGAEIVSINNSLSTPGSGRGAVESYTNILLYNGVALESKIFSSSCIRASNRVEFADDQ